VVEDITELVRIDMRRFGTYSPCKSPEVIAKKLGVPETEILKLDANENPYGCSPRVREALANYPYLNLYPDAAQTELREQLSGYVGLSPDHVVAGNGSDELIDLLLRMFIAPGDEVVTTVPTFDMYRFSTQVCRGKVIEVLRLSNFEVDVPAIKAAITKRTRLIFITNPNNPTGTVVPQNDILSLVETGLPVVIDEAYYEFCGQTAANLVPEKNNLMVLRTFSKWAGLAGLRIGYGIFPADIADILLKIKPPYNVSMAAMVAARESLKDSEYLLGTVRKIINERVRLLENLREVKYLKPIPSQANFILCQVTQGEAKKIQDELEKKGILVRYYNTPLLRNYIRISVGKPEQTDRVIKELKEIGERELYLN
jgi:histidinol-phosphate aminotransferase